MTANGWGGMVRARERGKTRQLRPLDFFHRQNYLNSIIYTNQPMAYYLQFNTSSR